MTPEDVKDGRVAKRSEGANAAGARSVLIYSGQDQIGDGIIKLPFLHACRARFPGAHITWLSGLGKTVYAGLLKDAAAPFVDEVIECAGVGKSPGELLLPRAIVRKRHFDLIIDTQRLVLRTLILKRLSHRQFVSGTAGFMFSDTRPEKGNSSPRSFSAYLMQLLDLAAPQAVPDPAFAMPLASRVNEAAAALLPDGPSYIGFSPGAGDKSKCWPLDNFIELARKQKDQGRVPVFFLGPEEKDWLTLLASAVPEALFPEWNRLDPYGDVKGPLLVMALAARLKAAVANDSGTGHMLAVGGAPLVSIFAKHDPKKYAPGARLLEVVDAKDYGGVDASLVPIAAVEEALNRLLARAG
jgi:ADP-heptose:LPS heptosyltransferase